MVGIDYDMDTEQEQERVEDDFTIRMLREIAAAPEGTPITLATAHERALEDAIDRLRARQREEHPTMQDHCLDCGSANVQVFSRVEKYDRPGLLEGEATPRDATPQREDDRLVPEACPHCSGLMGHYGDCPHGPQREGEREPYWKAMLERYGDHHSDCYWLADRDPSQGCNCGWQQRVHEHGLDVRLGVPPLEGVHAAAYEREDGRWSASVHLNGGYGMAVRSSLGLAMREALNGAIEERAAEPPADTEEGDHG